MAYNDVPLANQRISDTQPLIQSNFQQIQAAISVNHVPIADGTGDQGKHKFIQFPVQVVTPVFSATEFGLWNESDGAHNQLYINNPTNLATTQIPLAASTLDTNAAPTSANGIFTYIPSSFIIQARSFAVNADINGEATLTFPKAFPNLCIVAIPVLTLATANAFVISSSNATVNNFKISCRTSANASTPNGTALNGSYIAIGY